MHSGPVLREVQQSRGAGKITVSMHDIRNVFRITSFQNLIYSSGAVYLFCKFDENSFVIFFSYSCQKNRGSNGGRDGNYASLSKQLTTDGFCTSYIVYSLTICRSSQNFITFFLALKIYRAFCSDQASSCFGICTLCSDLPM